MLMARRDGSFLLQSEYDTLRSHAKELWLRTLLAIAYAFGLRKSEMLKGIRVWQVSLKDNTIDLRGADTKNNKSRVVVMTDEVRALVAACIEGKESSEFLLTRDDEETGKRTLVRDIRSAWNRMFSDAGIERRLVHDLRRSSIRNMVRRGIPEKVAMMISGHKTRSVFDRYNITALDDLNDAAQKIAAGAAKARSESETDKKTDTFPSATPQEKQAVP